MSKKSKLARWLTNHLPRKVIYFAVIRAWAITTTGEWSRTDVTTLTVNEVLKRLSISMGGNL